MAGTRSGKSGRPRLNQKSPQSQEAAAILGGMFPERVAALDRTSVQQRLDQIDQRLERIEQLLADILQAIH